MPSALTPTGSTKAWRALREPFEIHLATVGALPCRRCGQPITADMAWQLGHPDDNPRALGGDDSNLWPEHAYRIPGVCEGGSAAGTRLGNQLRAQRRAHAANLTPSREW